TTIGARLSEQRPQARPVPAQPALVLAVVRAARLDELPEALGVVHDVQVRHLVLDDVGQHWLRRQQQPPAEAHRTGRGAAGPPAGRVAYLQLRVGRACPERGPVEAFADLDSGAAAVPAHERVADSFLAALHDTH